MHFHSHIYLPDAMTAHQRTAWRHVETRLGTTVTEAGWRPERPYYIQGEITLSESDLPQHLQYSDEGHTWCRDCAQKIQAAVIARHQALLSNRQDLEDDLVRLLEKDPATFDWWDVEAFFEHLQSDAPFLCECDVGDSSDTCCSGCGATLDHSHQDHSFGEEMDYYEREGVLRVSVETAFCVLMLMNHKPGDPAVFKVARDTLSNLEANGLYRHGHEPSVPADDAVASA